MVECVTEIVCALQNPVFRCMVISVRFYYCCYTMSSCATKMHCIRFLKCSKAMQFLGKKSQCRSQSLLVQYFSGQLCHHMKLKGISRKSRSYRSNSRWKFKILAACIVCTLNFMMAASKCVLILFGFCLQFFSCYSSSLICLF